MGGERVGIVAVLTKETKHLSSPGDRVGFTSIEESLRRAVHDLHELGVHKIIALSHSGLNRDKQVASSIDGINVIHILTGGRHALCVGA